MGVLNHLCDVTAACVLVLKSYWNKLLGIISGGGGGGGGVLPYDMGIHSGSNVKVRN